MGCNFSKPSEIFNSYNNPIFENIEMTNDEKCKALEYINQMDVAKLPYLNTYGVLLGLKKNKSWNLYFHFVDWKVPINTSIIDNLINQFRVSMKLWLSNLKGYNGFPNTVFNIKIFGFVFNEGVTFDSSFINKYGNYPRVTNWKENNEKSPWIVEYKGKRVIYLDLYDSNLDFTELKVVGNKSTDAKFFPTNWENFKHPENI